MIQYYLAGWGVMVIALACLMLIAKGPPRKGMHPYDYGTRRADEWLRPKLFAIGGLLLVTAAVLSLFDALAAS